MHLQDLPVSKPVSSTSIALSPSQPHIGPACNPWKDSCVTAGVFGSHRQHKRAVAQVNGKRRGAVQVAQHVQVERRSRRRRHRVISRHQPYAGHLQPKLSALRHLTKMMAGKR